MKTAVQRLLAIPALVGAFSLAAGTAALGQEAEADAGASASQRTFVSCIGGPQEFVNGGTQNAPSATAAALATLPFSTFSAGASGGLGDSDLYVVTLSGEGDNSAVGGGFDVQAQASINGGAFFDMNPDGPNRFLQSTVAETNTVTWCNRFRATNSVVIRIRLEPFQCGLFYPRRLHRSGPSVELTSVKHTGPDWAAFPDRSPAGEGP